MAIAEDASAPAAVHNLASTSLTAVTASFSPPANSLVVVVVNIGLQGSSATMTVTMADSLSNSYTAGPHDYLFSAQGIYYFTHYYSSAPGSITVTATRSNAGTGFFGLDTLVLTGAASSQSGAATGTAEFDAVTPLTASITPTTLNSWVLNTVNANATTLTASGLTQDSNYHDGTDGGCFASGHVLTSSATAETIGWTPNAAAYAVWASLEILPVVSGYPVGLAAGTGTARGPVIELTPALATATGAALNTFYPRTALSAGTAQPPAAGVQATAGLATGTGAALTIPPAYTGPITVDASTPAAVHNLASTSLTATTASFSPPANSLVVVAVYIGLTVNNATMTMTMADSLSNSYTAGPNTYAFSNTGTYYFTYYYSSAPGSITVTATRSNANSGFFGMDTTVYTGIAASQAGAATGTATFTSVTPLTQAITPTVLSSWMLNAVSANALSLIASAQTQDTNYHDGTDGGCFASGHAATFTLTSESVGWTPNAAAYATWAALEILPAGQTVTTWLATGIGAAPGPVTGLAPVLATGTGTAQPPNTSQGVSLIAGLPAGTGSAWPPANGAGASGTQATGTGHAVGPLAPAAIAKDPSAPAAVHLLGSVSLTAVTASFSPPAGSMVVAVVYLGLQGSDATVPVVTMADSGSVSYTAGPSNYLFSDEGLYFFSHYYAAAPGTITLTATRSAADLGFFGIDTIVLSGTSPVQTGAAAQTASIDNVTAMTAAITPTRDNSWIITAVTASAASATPAGLIQDANFHDGTDGGTYAIGHFINTDTLVPETIGFTAGTSPNFAVWAALEILPASANTTWLPTVLAAGAGIAPAPSAGITAGLASGIAQVPSLAGQVPVINLIDDFTANDLSSLWGNSFGAPAWMSALVAIKSDSGYDQGLISTSTFGLTASSVFACVIPFQSSPTSETYLQIKDPNGNYASAGYKAGKLTALYYLAGIGKTQIASISYNSASHSYWRIHEAGGTLYFDAAPDGLNWSNFASVANPGINVAAVGVTLYAGDFGGNAAGYSYVRSVNTVAYGAVPVARLAAATGYSQGPIPDPPNVVVDFTTKTVSTDPLGAGLVISEFGNTSYAVPIVNDTTWKGLITALAPGHCRCSVAWYGGAPNCGAQGSPGSGGPGANAIINAIKSTGAIPLVSFDGDSSDNGFNPADGGSLVAYMNSGAGLTAGAGPVHYWSIGNEADNAGIPSIAADPSAPAAVHNLASVSATATTASFSPPANSLVVVVVNIGLTVNNATMTVTMADSASVNYTAGPSDYLFSSQGIYYFTHYYTAAPGSITVTATRSNANSGFFGMDTLVLTGAAPNQAGAATGTFEFDVVTPLTQAITPTVVNSWILNTVNANATTLTANGLIQDANYHDGTDGGCFASGHVLTPSLAPETVGWTPNGAAYAVWVSLEILPVVSGVTVAQYESTANATGSAPSAATAMLGSDPTIVIGAPAASYWNQNFVQWAAGQAWCKSLGFHASDGAGNFPGTSEYGNDVTTALGMKSGVMAGVEAFNWQAAGASFSQTGTWQECVWIADVMGQILSHGGHGTVYADANGPLSVIGDGTGGTTLYQRMPAYWGIGIWTGMNGQFKRYSANVVTASTTFSATSVNAYAFDNGKIVVVNKDNTSHQLAIGITMAGGATAGTYSIWATAGTGSPFGAITQVVSNATFTNGVLAYLIPAGTAVSIEVTPEGGAVQPTGIPGNWAIAFDDEFPGPSLNTNNWFPATWTGQNVTFSPSNVIMLNPGVSLQLASSASGAQLQTNTYQLPVGGYAEARIWFPGDGAPTPGNTVYNWPAWWASDITTWPAAGEEDIAEGLAGTLTNNYHSPSGTFNGPEPGPAGNWSNSWHTYGMLRGASMISWYFDGALVHQQAPSDNGGGQNLLLSLGSGGGTAVYGTASAMKVAYVRAWVPSTGTAVVAVLATGIGTAQPPTYTATGATLNIIAGLATGTGTAWPAQAQGGNLEIISPVAGQAGTNYTFGANFITLTLPHGITPGNLIVACLVARNSGITVTPPPGWAQAGTGAMLSGTLGTQIFYLVARSADAGTASFTFTYSSSVGQLGTIREWNSTSGWLNSPVDQTAAYTAYSSATVKTGTTGTTAQTSELAVAVLSWISDALTESGLTAGYTAGLTVTQNYNSVREAYQILSAAGMQACQETISAAENNAGFLVTFMPAPGQVSGPYTVTAAVAAAISAAGPVTYSSTGTFTVTGAVATAISAAQPVTVQFTAGWTFVGDTASSTTTGTSFTVNVPAGVQNGDNLILYATGNCPSAGSFNLPAGWTQIYRQSLGVSTSHIFLLATRTASSEPASYTVTTTATAQPVVGIYAVRGGTGQVLGSAMLTRPNTANNYQTYLTTPGYDKLQNNSLLVFGYGGVNAAGSGGGGLILPSSSPDLLTGSSTADHQNASGGADMALLASKVTTGKLCWAPPPMGMGGRTVTTLNLVNTGANQSLSLNNNIDYIIHLDPNNAMFSGIQIHGGHNIIVIGGEIQLAVPGYDANQYYGFFLAANQGSVFIEGVWIYNPTTIPASSPKSGGPSGDPTGPVSTGDGMDTDTNPGQAGNGHPIAPGLYVQTDNTWQNMRVTGVVGKSGGSDHADIWQPYLLVNSLGRVDRFTGSSADQGMNLDPDLSMDTTNFVTIPSPPTFDIRRVNLATISNPYDGDINTYTWWLTHHLDGGGGPVNLVNCWSLEPSGDLAANAVWPDTVAGGGPSGAQSVWNASTQQLTFPNTPQISGVINYGTPPGGDFVPLGVAGRGYVSPGYTSAGDAWIPTGVDQVTFVLELAAALPSSQIPAGLAHATGTAQPPGAFSSASATTTAAGKAGPVTAGLAPGLATGIGASPQAYASISGSAIALARLANAIASPQPPGTGLAPGSPAGTSGAGNVTGQQVISSPALEGYSFGSFTQVPSGSAIQSVDATIVQYASNSLFLAPVYQLWDGTSSMIGSITGTASTVPGFTETVSFTGVTYAQLATLRLRIIARSYTGNAGATFKVDAVALSAVWLPGVNSVIFPATLNVAPAFPAPTVVGQVNASVTPAVKATSAVFPSPVAGAQSASIHPAVVAKVPAFPVATASTALSAFTTPSVLAIVPAFPAIIDVTSENWAGSEDIAVSGTGSWTSPGNVTGSPDGSTATWTAT